MDFGTVYGEMGIGYIHVHHVAPLSDITGEREINPTVGLVPVCPNCHAMLHTPPRPSVSRLRDIPWASARLMALAGHLVSILSTIQGSTDLTLGLNPRANMRV